MAVPLSSVGPRGTFTDVSHKVRRVGHILCDGKGPPPRGAEVLGLRVGAERAGVLPAKAGEPSGREGAGGAAVVRCGQEPDSVSFRGRLYRVQLLPPICQGPLCCGSRAAGELSSRPRGLCTQEFRLSPVGPQCWWWHLVSPCSMLMTWRRWHKQVGMDDKPLEAFFGSIHLPSPVLGAGDTAVSKTDENPFLVELILLEETEKR